MHASEKVGAAVQELKNRLVDLKQKISARRKEGGYVGVAEVMLMNVPAKIKLFEIDGTDEQKAAIEELFSQVEQELRTEYP